MKIISSFALLFLFGSACAQSLIVGTVKDEGGEPLEFVNVVLCASADSAIVKVAVTNAAGRYELEPTSEGAYRLQFNYIGLENVWTDAFEWKPGMKLEQPSVVLKPKATTSAAVEVVFTKPIVEVKPDKVVFNVENSMNAAGLNAMELLRKAPGVQVDNNENIAIKGRAGVIVYIDGKLSPLNGDGLKAYLKGLQSSNIESIEIISNPSSKYDAAGTAGIINIRLKKNKNFGTNGDFQLGYGVQIYSKYNTGFTVNRRTERWNLFANYNNNWGKNWSWMNFNRYQSEQQFVQKTHGYDDEFNHTFKAGADYYLKPRTSVGVMVNGNFINKTWYNFSGTDISPLSNLSDVTVLDATNTLTTHQDNLSANLNFHTSDSTGMDWTIDADYGQYTIRSGSYQPNTYKYPGTDLSPVSIVYRNVTPVDISIASLKSDYEQTLGKGKIGVGFKLSFVETRNTLDFYNVNGNVEVLDSTRSNSFNYKENINAAYVNYDRTFGKLALKAGVRAENTNSRGTLTSLVALSNESERDITRNYTNLFPSGGLTYNINDTNQVSFTYSRRIQRPSYQDLNPFEVKMDELSYMRGNPFLQPQYANVFELSHTYMFMLTTSINYTHTKDYFTAVTDTANRNASYIINRNLGSQDWIGLNISSPVPIKKWWNAFVNLGGGQLYNKAEFDDGRVISVRVWGYNVFMQNTFTLSKTLSAEVSGWVSGPSIWGGTFVNKAMGSLDVGLKWDIWDGKATIRLAKGDLLRTSYWRSVSQFGGVEMRGSGGWESRLFRINFNYNFGNQQVKVRERKSGADDLKNRVK